MKILLATDGSENASAAAAFLGQLPVGDKTLEIILVSVVHTPDLHRALGNEEIKKQFLRARKDEIHKTFEGTLNTLASLNVPVEEIVLEGHPGRAILEEADKQQVDLIMMGAIGTSLLDRLLLGSTSEFVATHAKCSVMIVRPGENTERRVLVSYDGSPQSTAAIEQLSASGWAGEAPVDLVYVVSLPTVGSTTDDAGVLREELRTQAQTELDEAAAKPGISELKMSANLVDSSHVGRALCKFATEHGNSLMVMGSTGHGLLTRFLLGSVSRYVLRHAPCSVWIMRQPESA